jgi:hypothetical protein
MPRLTNASRAACLACRDPRCGGECGTHRPRNPDIRGGRANTRLFTPRVESRRDGERSLIPEKPPQAQCRRAGRSGAIRALGVARSRGTTVASAVATWMRPAS